MSRLPPTLLYLTIYNPTLHPYGPIDEDDEDAEEQAHILFYTSRERAVSRDRMLRQVGLAKALVSFSEMFNANDACDSVHSQSKRMILVSPEPGFWIHAAVEVARVPKVPAEKGKGKAKAKAKEKSKSSEKGKEKENEKEPVLSYDCIEGSVHDVALRRAILRGYEQFKLRHGSFTSILSTSGQEALELQLERFFTVWAWSWNLEDGQEFGDHLGIPLHPAFRSLVPLLDAFASELPDTALPVLISSAYVVPSTQYAAAEYSSSLTRHLLSLIPPAVLPSNDTAPSLDRDATVTAGILEPGALSGKDPPKGSESAASFLGMPAVNMNVTKWNWSGYMSFGRGGGKKVNAAGTEENKLAPIPHVQLQEDIPVASSQEVQVDKNALEDAISENISFVPADTLGEHVEDTSGVPPPDGAIDPAETNGMQTSHIRIPTDSDSSPSLDPAALAPVTPDPLPLEFSFTIVHLAKSDDPLMTVRQGVSYLLKDRLMLALVGLTDEVVGSTEELVQQASTFLEQVQGVIDAEAVHLLSDSLPSAAKILQPTDSHIVNVGNFTISSSGFTSTSAHLYQAQELRLKDEEISEVFSRGQNPQHWHITRRGLSMGDEGNSDEGEVYMGIYRKEASLGDVDNVLAGVVRRCGLGDGSLR